MARNRELSESDLSYCTKAMVKYILNHAVKKQYMKTSEITKHCLKSESRFFDLVFEEAKAMLSDIYSLSIKEMKDKKLGKFFICKSKLESSSEYEYTVEQRLELKLLFIVLSYIYMKGDTVFESTLFGFLRKLGFSHEEHEYFGDYRTLITEKFVKQLYLKKEKVEMETGNNEDCFQYSWGHRARLEFSKEQIFETVAIMLDKPKEAFPKQFEELNAHNESQEEVMDVS